MSPDAPLRRRGATSGFFARFALAGVVIGAVLGFGGAALVSAAGIGDADLPPLSAATTPTPSATPTPTPTTATTSTPGVPPPTIEVSSSNVSPGERFVLSGTFPTSDEGEQLQVEVRDVDDDASSDWDEFPIKTTTRDGGEFKTELYTSRTGEREFRVTNKDTGKSTPAVKVAIG